MTSYEGNKIHVAVFGYRKGLRITKMKVEEGKVKPKDGTSISFKEDDVIPIWVRSGLGHTWAQGIAWREGTDKAISMDTNKDEFLPLLTRAEHANFIQKTTAEAKEKAKRVMSNWQFAALLIVLIAVAVMVALNLFGIHFSIDSGTAQTVTNSTVTPPSNTTVVIP